MSSVVKQKKRGFYIDDPTQEDEDYDKVQDTRLQFQFLHCSYQYAFHLFYFETQNKLKLLFY